jgi:hypothetical protein
MHGGRNRIPLYNTMEFWTTHVNRSQLRKPNLYKLDLEHGLGKNPKLSFHCHFGVVQFGCAQTGDATPGAKTSAIKNTQKCGKFKTCLTNVLNTLSWHFPDIFQFSKTRHIRRHVSKPVWHCHGWLAQKENDRLVVKCPAHCRCFTWKNGWMKRVSAANLPFL